MSTRAAGDRARIPLFPLTQVLLPGMPLPLRVFEPRYRRLLADVAAAAGTGAGDRPAGFGVVAVRRGSEVGPLPIPDIAGTGTFAEIVEVSEQPDATIRVLTVGSTRFSVEQVVDNGTPYPCADVRWRGEPVGELAPTQLACARGLGRRITELLGTLDGRPSEFEPFRDATMLSYQLAAQAPLTPVDRMALLAVDTTAERLALLAGLLRREIGLLQATRSIAMAPAVLQLAAEPN